MSAGTTSGNGVPSEAFLRAVGPTIFESLRSRGRVRSFERGTVLFHESQTSEHVAILLEGTVKVTLCEDHDRDALLAIRGPGDLIGELGAVESKPRFGTITALEPVEALVVPSSAFRDILANEPSAWKAVIELLASRLRDSDRKRAQFGTHDTGARVAARIVELGDRFGERVDERIRINLPLTQDELALWTGCSREAVAKAMQAMRELGWLETGRRSIVITDEDALRRRAMHPSA